MTRKNYLVKEIPSYKNLIERRRGRILSNSIFPEDNIYIQKNRRKIVSLSIPINHIENRYLQLIEKIRVIEKRHYMFPPSRLYVEIYEFNNFVEEYNEYINFENQFFEQRIISLVDQIIEGIKNFNLVFDGITSSLTTGIIKGYDVDNGLKIVREKISCVLSKEKLYDMDQYGYDTAPITYMRYMRKLADPLRYIEFLDANKGLFIAYKKIKTIELLEHDNFYIKKRIIKKYTI
jgi:hypothetical protein